MELKVPPLVVVFTCALLAWGLAAVSPEPSGIASGFRTITSGVVFAAGLLLIALALRGFHNSQTTVDPLHPDSASRIVTGGVYSVTRNPMYLSMFLVLTSWVIYLGQPFGILVLVVYAAYMTRFQIIPEERILTEKFGDEYKAYRLKVRRWI